MRTAPTEFLLTCECAQCHNIMFCSCSSASRSTVSTCVISWAHSKHTRRRGAEFILTDARRLLSLTLLSKQRDQESWQTNGLLNHLARPTSNHLTRVCAALGEGVGGGGGQNASSPLHNNVCLSEAQPIFFAPLMLVDPDETGQPRQGFSRGTVPFSPSFHRLL